jgi:hypothetical protein
MPFLKCENDGYCWFYTGLQEVKNQEAENIICPKCRKCDTKKVITISQYTQYLEKQHKN